MLTLHSLSMRRRMHVGCALIVALAAVMCGTSLLESYQQYQHRYLDLHYLTLVEHTLLSSNSITAERWAANRLLVLQRRNSTQWMLGEHEARASSDRALDTLRTALGEAAALDEFERSSMLNTLASIRARLSTVRNEVDLLAARPQPARTIDQVQSAQDRMFAIADELAALTNRVMTGTAMSHPDTSNALLVTLLFSDMREYAGRLGALFVASLAANEQLDEVRLARILQTRGRIVQLRALIGDAIGPLRDDPTLASDFVLLNNALDSSFLPLVSVTLSAGRTGAYVMDVEDFMQRIVRYLHASEQLRDHVIDFTHVRALALTDAARVRMTLSAVGAVCCITILFVLMRSTHRMLVKPLDTLSRRIIALTKDEVSPVARVPGAGTELARINDALDALSDVYVRRKLLERQRDDMLTLFSHELRAPLTSVIVLVSAPLPCASKCMARERLQEVGALTRNTLAIADGFAQVSRAEAGPYAPELVNITDLMNQARDEIWPRARAKYISVEDVPYIDEALVHGDPVMLSRALVKLLENAVMYSAAHTRIECSVALAGGGKSVRCEIRDHGYGIAAEDQARLFERYRRFRLKGQPETPGVGLGMAFAKAVVERHSGEISVRSSVWHGTTVTMLLPKGGDFVAGTVKMIV